MSKNREAKKFTPLFGGYLIYYGSPSPIYYHLCTALAFRVLFGHGNGILLRQCDQAEKHDVAGQEKCKSSACICNRKV